MANGFIFSQGIRSPKACVFLHSSRKLNSFLDFFGKTLYIVYLLFQKTNILENHGGLQKIIKAKKFSVCPVAFPAAFFLELQKKSCFLIKIFFLFLK